MKARKRSTMTRHGAEFRPRRIAALAMGCLLLGTAGTAAHGYKVGAISVGHIWAPSATEDGEPVYGPFLNNGNDADRLVGASSPVADEVRIQNGDDGGETSWQDGIALPAGRPVAMAAWSPHLWLTGIKAPVAAGKSFPLTLTFEKAGSVTVEVVVEDAPTH